MTDAAHPWSGESEAVDDARPAAGQPLIGSRVWLSGRWTDVAGVITLLLLTGNTMSQALRERIPEIGVLKTIGFRDGTILGLVLAKLDIRLDRAIQPHQIAAAGAAVDALGIDHGEGAKFRVEAGKALQ